MPALTLKNIPDALYSQLRAAAKVHRRSLNSEILYCVEHTLTPYKVNVPEQLAIARKLREKTAEYPISDDDIIAAINEGRP